MNAEHPCPRCGALLPGEVSPRGCPRCLLAAGLESPTVPGRADPIIPQPADLAPLFPELEILEERGRGGMGIVYKARQRRLDRIVALKILSAGAEDEPSFAERFTREATALARLSHPNIVTVFDSGETGGIYYLLMEFIEGTTLRSVLKNGEMRPEQALALVSPICDALGYAHDQGVVHRDIKPENILLSLAGEVKIADFGLAKLAGTENDKDRLTAAGQVMGTPQYMAPEQIESPGDVDHRADIYSLGVVFYEMLTGELPIGRFAPPSRKVQIDVRIDDVVLRTLAKERERRYQHAAEVKTRVSEIGGFAGRNVDIGEKRPADETRAPGPPPHVAPAEAKPRWSKLAVSGFVCLIVAMLISCVGIIYSGPFISGVFRYEISNPGLYLFEPFESMMLATMLTSFATLIHVVGLGLSIAGWVVVVRSKGGLKGLSFAMMGTFGPVVSHILYGFLAWMTMSRAIFHLSFL